MNICGIITEYNPMHLGHDYQVKSAKTLTNAGATILIMSGNFVQRGEPAIIDKYARAQAAVATGIDLVIELPCYFATSSAEYFASYATKLLDATGVVTHLNFGSESGDLTGLKAVADILTKEPLGYKVLLNDYLKSGLSFPKARQQALIQYNENHHIISPSLIQSIQTPNNILGIEYIKALNRLKSTIEVTTIQRIGATYHNEDSQVAIPSASSIRRHLESNAPLELLSDKMPTASFKKLTQAIEAKKGPIYVKDIFPYIRHQLLQSSSETLATYMDIDEGLENRFLKAINTCTTYDDFIDAVATKRYTSTRIARSLIHIYLGHTKAAFNRYYKDMAPYLKVLAFNKQGQSIIKAIKEANEDLPIIVNNRQGYKLLDPLQQACYMADINSTLLYNHLIAMKYGTQVKNDYQVKIMPI